MWKSKRHLNSCPACRLEYISQGDDKMQKAIKLWMAMLVLVVAGLIYVPVGPASDGLPDNSTMGYAWSG